MVNSGGEHTRSIEITFDRPIEDEDMLKIHRYIRRMFKSVLMQSRSRMGGFKDWSYQQTIVHMENSQTKY